RRRRVPGDGRAPAVAPALSRAARRVPARERRACRRLRRPAQESDDAAGRRRPRRGDPTLGRPERTTGVHHRGQPDRRRPTGPLRDTVWRIDYVGQPGAFAAFPAGALMAVARSGVRPEGDNPFRGKIVLVGATFGEIRDFYGTPMGLMSGVEIQANIVHTLLS